MQPPKTVNISLHELIELLQYYWAAVNSKKIGDLGLKSYEEIIYELDKQSTVRISPSQLEHLVYHAKEVIMNRIDPIRVNRKAKSYYPLMKRLEDQVPQLFKTTSSGEIVFIEMREKEYDV